VRVWCRLLMGVFVVVHSSLQTANGQADLRLWYEQPAQVWEEAMPIGNGRIGAMVFGRTLEERIQFNEETLWRGKPHDYVRNGARDHLAEIRRLVFAGEHEAAARIVRAHFLSDPVRQMAYQPFGDVRLQVDGHHNVTDYRRELNLDTAIATTTYRLGDVTYTREAFASYPDQVIVVTIYTSQPGQVSFRASFDCPHADWQTARLAADTLALRGRVQPDGLSFEARLHVRVEGGHASVTDRQITVERADRVTLLLAAHTSFVSFEDVSGDPAARCESTLAKLGDKPVAAIRRDHIADHQRLFRRVRFDLGRTDRADLPTDQRLARLSRDISEAEGLRRDHILAGLDTTAGLAADPALAALYFQFGRYLLIASSRPGGEPANLQGIWNELLKPSWESKYTLNINLQMNYWPAEVTNLAELHEPVFEMIDDLRIAGARTAAKQYGARGWVVHHNTDLWRGCAPINNVEGVWPTGAAWLCHHLWDHYLFSRDRAFLEQRAYPAMKEAAMLFLDTLVEDPNTGYLVTNPSHSPELGPLVPGPTMDNQLIRALFDYTIEAASILRVDVEFVSQLRKTRDRLPPNRVGRHGQLQEWQADLDKPGDTHRHLSPLWGLYPGWDITPADPAVFDAARLLLTWRGDGSTGWSYAWRAAAWARVQDGAFAYRQLSLQLARSTYPSLLDRHPPFQIDGNFGATGAMAEWLLQSHLRTQEGHPIIQLLPALPPAWKGGTITGLRARGGFEVDMAWAGGQLQEVVIRSAVGSPCRLRYGEASVDLHLQAGEAIRLDGHLQAAVGQPAGAVTAP